MYLLERSVEPKASPRNIHTWCIRGGEQGLRVGGDSPTTGRIEGRLIANFWARMAARQSGDAGR